ncbi:forespore capture DNA-binding protein RefZ [Neobacillus sp. PS3-34]|uniref:forespore capture DNA-binding protein RefZ n=1 Tax=Neobacillus sp. PS3-34 TaxID=3070678 RepID=UPI0027E1DF46|nr:forespore capture DNA-binding protein RefZ [Neobacillus sp. PS3-34]WML47285.1 forespore capture DNA-binding protein RefZ [Neobacillus sp. PS3-34]
MVKNSKEAIVNAAISLFNTKGYSGTSIRDIAGSANVNIANIAYYFQNKHGLLEHCFTSFFEQYLAELEAGYVLLNQGAEFCLKNISANLLNFYFRNIHLTRFILREMSIDSQVVREIMSTYCLKEKYLLQKVLEKGKEWGEFRPHSSEYMIIQLKGLLTMPFLNPHYITEVLHVYTHERFFVEKYQQEIDNWIVGFLCTGIKRQKEAMLL